MGKASSSKKVARAARAGGRVSTGQSRSLLFPGIVALIAILGLALVFYAREDRRDDDLGGVPQIGDHIHQAVGVYACGEFLPDLPVFESDIGIHTHADGVIHIHPFSELAAGANATLSRYIGGAAEEGGLDFSLSDTKLTYLDETFEEGETTCEGEEDPELRVAYWPDVQFSEDDPELRTGDFGDLRLTEDGAGITIYFGDPDADIPKPPTAAQLAELGARDGGQAPTEQGSTTTAADGSTTTTAADTGTTAAG